MRTVAEAPAMLIRPACDGWPLPERAAALAKAPGRASFQSRIPLPWPRPGLRAARLEDGGGVRVAPVVKDVAEQPGVSWLPLGQRVGCEAGGHGRGCTEARVS